MGDSSLINEPLRSVGRYQSMHAPIEEPPLWEQMPDITPERPFWNHTWGSMLKVTDDGAQPGRPAAQRRRRQGEGECAQAPGSTRSVCLS